MQFRREPARRLPQIADTPFHQWLLPDGSTWAAFYRIDGGYLLRFPSISDFEVTCDGTQVIALPALRVRSSAIDHLFLNQVKPLALSRQGRFVLHASAVAVGGRAVAFAGASGLGKSTLAASFAVAGFPFLSDDCLELRWSGERPCAGPSHPSIRLNPDSEAALGIRASTAPDLAFADKVRFLAGPGLPFRDTPLALGALMFLGDPTHEGVQLDPLDGAAALIEIVRHSFLLDMSEQDLLAQHFGEIAKLANEPIHHRLRYPRRYTDLPAVREAIQNHLGRDRKQ